MVLSTIEFWAAEHCTYAVSGATKYLILFYYTSHVITIGLYIFGLRNKELYLIILGFGLSLNSWFNFALKFAFAQAVPERTCGSYAFFCIDPAAPPSHNACGTPPANATHIAADATCGAPPLDACLPCVPCGMPSFEVQQTTFFVASVLIFRMQWRAPHIRVLHVVALLVLHVVVSYISLFFNLNSAAQVVVGGAFGAAFALLYQLLVFCLPYPHFDAILGWRLVRWFGYADTYCRSHVPVPGDEPPMAPVVVDADDADFAV